MQMVVVGKLSLLIGVRKGELAGRLSCFVAGVGAVW